MIYLETISSVQPSFSSFHKKKVDMKECRVELNKGAPEIKTDVESHPTRECKGLSHGRLRI